MMKGQKGYILTGKPLGMAAAPGLWAALRTRLQRWIELHRQRKLLAQLSDAALKDMGLSRADIAEESRRPFWDDPLQR